MSLLYGMAMVGTLWIVSIIVSDCTLSLGAGKQVYGDLGFKSYRCFLGMKNMTETDHLNTFG